MHFERLGSVLLVGRSLAPIARSVRELAPLDISVPILGETGVGKELIARALFELSQRRQGPFVTLNCGGVPESLLEDTLFGHVAGAFTGAHRERIGHVEAAHGGTLFLDEIAEMSPRLQATLLRFLESGEFSRVGETRTRHADVRILAATHGDLDALVAAGTFRADLYHRILGSAIRLPPLRGRKQDIPELAEYFMRYWSQRLKKSRIVLRPPVMRVLLGFPWPGNVRQFRNLIMELAARRAGRRIRTADLEPHLGKSQDPAAKPNEKAEIQWALTMANGVVSDAALYFGCARPHFYRLMRKHGLGPTEH